MNWYPWLNHYYKKFIHEYQEQRAHHALLIHSLPGMGEDLLVWGVSRWLICKQRNKWKSCGQCHSCQLMKAHTYPDWYCLKADKGKSCLSIDSVRNVENKIHDHAQQSGAKIVWLPDANQITEEAANAMLKMLEEPPKNTWFFLCTSEPLNLLRTVRSRCLTWHLIPPNETQSLQWLQQHTLAGMYECIAALRLSYGAPVSALKLLEKTVWRQRENFFSALHEVLVGGGDMLNLLLSKLDNDDAVRCISWLCTILIDAAKWQYGGVSYISNIDRKEDIMQIANLLSIAMIESSLKQWIQCRNHLLNIITVNRKLLLVEQLLNWEIMIKPV